MPPYAAFHLGFHCLTKYPFRDFLPGFLSTKGYTLYTEDNSANRQMTGAYYLYLPITGNVKTLRGLKAIFRLILLNAVTRYILYNDFYSCNLSINIPVNRLSNGLDKPKFSA